MKNDYRIFTKNLNSSLVFYRSLFNKMPDEMTAYNLEFSSGDLKVEIIEDTSLITQNADPFHLSLSPTSLKKVLGRMKHFTRINQLKEDCEEPEKSIGLMDPDGNKWIVGAYDEDISFEKCYINF